MAYIDTLIASKPRVYNIYNDSPNGDIPLIDTQFGNFDFSLAYEATITDLFRAGTEDQPFSIEVWTNTGTVRIGHSSGGVTIYAKRITVDFATGSYEVKLLEETAKHVVLSYSLNSLRIYVNNEVVFEADPSGSEFHNESILGIYQISAGAKYDGFAVYDRPLSPKDVTEHWNVGTSISAFSSEQRYAPMQWQPNDTYVANDLVEFDTQIQWIQGLVNDVVVTDTIDSMIENEVAVDGDWTCNIPLHVYDAIHGIKLEYSATDNASLVYTLNGVTTALTGTTKFAAAGDELEINITFPAGQVCKVDWLRATIYTSTDCFAFQELTTTLDNVTLPAQVWEPNLLNARAGALVGGSIEFTDAEDAIKELYAFIKPTTAGTVMSIGSVDIDDTLAITGAADIVASDPVDGWSYIKVTFDSATTNPITIENCTLLSLAISTTANPTLNVNKLFADAKLLHTEAELVAIVDTDVRAYSNKWAVTGAGG